MENDYQFYHLQNRPPSGSAAMSNDRHISKEQPISLPNSNPNPNPNPNPSISAHIPKFKLELSLETLLTRGQWYDLKCKFLTTKDEPAFVGRSVVIDSDVAFVDNRKRPPKNATESSFEINLPLEVSVFGECSNSHNMLKKCKKCKEQDKVTINRKRGRETETVWSPVDNRNNSKLLQLLDKGNYVVDRNGAVEIRFRGMCCIGATRQLHHNHIPHTEASGNQKVEPEPHKKCDGVLLSVRVKVGDTVVTYQYPQTIRIVGKVLKNTSVGKKVKNEEACFPPDPSPLPQPPSNALAVYSSVPNPSPHFPDPPRVDPAYIHNPSPWDDDNWKEPPMYPSKRIPPPNHNPKVPLNDFPFLYPPARKPPTFIQNNANRSLLRDQVHDSKADTRHIFQLYTIFGKNYGDAAALHRLAVNFLTIEEDFQTPYQEMFHEDFFEVENLSRILPISPEMLQIYNTLCFVDLSMKGGKRSDKVFPKIDELATMLLQKFQNFKLPLDQTLLLADGVSRAAIWRMYKKDFQKAKYYVTESNKLFDYIYNFDTSIKSHSAFHVNLWNIVSVHPSMNVLDQARTFNVNRNRPKLEARIIGQSILSLIHPDIQHYPFIPYQSIVTPLPEQETLLYWCDLWDDALTQAGYRSSATDTGVVASTANFVHLVAAGLRAWLLGDMALAYSEIADSAIQIPLVFEEHMEGIVLNIASYLAVQLVGYHVYHFLYSEEMNTEMEKKIIQGINVAEILLKFSSMSLWPWSRYVDEWNRASLRNFVMSWKKPI
eukprot:TRINITY_DN2694_c0_g5_i1.p1 TRINITY_DN2694_c0_g5~~TRINITY_DN2694_c0_g5_i1.p1  ORF type:complete len:770 (-),score=139.61 TRINITY_DN2694_c0_g5_i1:91-2400(-)